MMRSFRTSRAHIINVEPSSCTLTHFEKMGIREWVEEGSDFQMCDRVKLQQCCAFLPQEEKKNE